MSGEIVKRSFGNLHKNRVKLTDSQVVLHWLNNQSKPLKQWLRNRITEICRFTTPDEWMYVSSNNMIADIATRRVLDLETCSQDSIWISGFNWMRDDVSKLDHIMKSLLKIRRSKHKRRIHLKRI